MASWHSSFVTASKVGSQFVQQYYDVLQHQPEFTHRFYNGSSTIIRVDGDSTQTASAVSVSFIHILYDHTQFLSKLCFAYVICESFIHMLSIYDHT
ncbi:putative Ras GTPase-activating protein-binding protein [Helianthus anomalus]